VVSAADSEVPFVDLGAQYAAIGDELDSAWHEVVRQSQFVLGPRVAEFEREFASFVGAEHGVGVASGLDALRLALMALGLGSGDEVILPANSYIATALAVSQVGAMPVLVDCDPETYGIDPAQVEAAVTARTRAILPVHLTGQAADLGPLLDVAGDRLFLVASASIPRRTSAPSGMRGWRRRATRSSPRRSDALATTASGASTTTSPRA
jgi:dTDP-4-amino-4,6-dideoxygalactose transaminase